MDIQYIQGNILQTHIKLNTELLRQNDVLM